MDDKKTEKETESKHQHSQEHDCSGCTECGPGQLTQEELVHSLNVLMNALISVLVDKKVLTEKDIHDKLINDFGAQTIEK